MMTMRRVSVFLALVWGKALAFNIIPSFNVGIRGGVIKTDENEIELQKTLGIPDGLLHTLLTNAQQTFCKRIWIVDNSGSMAMGDGHLILSGSDSTRWKELEETVMCHAQLSSALHAPTDFHLLNNSEKGPSNFRVGYGTMRDELKKAQTVLSHTKPSGMTPLPESIAKIRKEVVSMLPELAADGTKVAIVIVTDGSNHNLENLGKGEGEINEELVAALESLQGLPVSVVVRLCTDYGPLVDFYNDLDTRTDLRLDVLDDYLAETNEVYQHNPWLNYALILHRMREMGQHSELFDLLDERTFTRDELRDFCVLVFGKEDLPDPNSDWKSFLQEINGLQQPERMHLNPRTQQMAPWIDIAGLAKLE